MPDNSTPELIGGLNLIGTSGNFCAILTRATDYIRKNRW